MRDVCPDFLECQWFLEFDLLQVTVPHDFSFGICRWFFAALFARSALGSRRCCFAAAGRSLGTFARLPDLFLVGNGEVVGFVPPVAWLQAGRFFAVGGGNRAAVAGPHQAKVDFAPIQIDADDLYLHAAAQREFHTGAFAAQFLAAFVKLRAKVIIFAQS